MTQTLPIQTLPDTGIISNMPEAVYHRLKRFSCSGIKAILRSPAHLKSQVDKAETSFMKQGSLIDVALTEPARLEKDYFVIPDDVVQNPRYKSYQAVLEKAGSRIIVKQQDMDKALRIRDAVHTHSTASQIIEGAQSQLVAFWGENTRYGRVGMKARIDFFNPKTNMLIDLKTTDDANAWSFGKKIAQFGYHIQDACYTRGLEAANDFQLSADSFVFLVVEREAPYGIKVYELPDRARNVGWQKYQEGVETYASCLTSNRWENYDDNGIETIDLPTYYYRENETF